MNASITDHMMYKCRIRIIRRSRVTARPFTLDFAKDCLLTLVKSRLALGSTGWLVGCLVVRHRAEKGPNTQEKVVDCPLVITSKVKLFLRPDKTRTEE